MSVVQAIDPITRYAGVLKAPYNSWSIQEVLEYFKSRQHIAYFTVPNDAEITRDKIDAILANQFTFNEECYDLPKLDWLINPSTDIEWSIMLHKFYYAVGLGIAYKETGDQRYVEKWLELTSSWIATVPVDFLSTDVTGRRIQNWIFAHYYFVTECPSDHVTPEFYLEFLTSIQQQVNYLCQHLTPARNHRTLELYTIYLAAVVFPEIKEAGYWLQFSIGELSKNIQSDILSDGVHCELSTDYHHIVLRNFLAVKRLAVLNFIELPELIDNGIKKALGFALYVHKPDGNIPSLSDGDTGSFLLLLQQGYEFYQDEAMRYVATRGQSGSMPEERSKAFPTGGYYILRSGWGEGMDAYQDERYLVFDCGDLGAGNHGHLDLLSFEMAAYGKSLIVDPGRYTYDESGEINWRVKFRGTGYHNTVQVDGLNQTRYEPHTHKYKIKGPQPDHELKAFHSQPGFDYVHGVAYSHEYPVVHERKILFINGEYWLICDLMRAEEKHNYDLLFHLSAAATYQTTLHSERHCLSVNAPNLVMMQPVHKSATLSLEGGYISPVYGFKQEAPVVKFTQQGAECCFYTLLYPYKDKKPSLTMTSLTVNQNDKLCDPIKAGAFAVTIQTEKKLSHDVLFIANQEGSYEMNGELITVPVFCKRTDKNGQHTGRYDYASLHTSNSVTLQRGV